MTSMCLGKNWRNLKSVTRLGWRFLHNAPVCRLPVNILLHSQQLTRLTSPVICLPCHQIQQSRCYAKDKVRKDKGKDKGKKSKPKFELTSNELNELINYDKMQHQMELALDQLKQDYVNQLTLRTSAGIFDNLLVETPDGKFPLIQLAQVAHKNPQLFVVNMAAVPQYIPAVKNAIMNSGMNLNPQQDGTSLFVPVPKVTREHREGLSKKAKQLCDKTKEKLKDIHNRSLRDLKKHKGGQSEDLVHHVTDYIHSTTHGFVTQAEEMTRLKQEELLGGK